MNKLLRMTLLSLSLLVGRPVMPYSVTSYCSSGSPSCSSTFVSMAPCHSVCHRPYSSGHDFGASFAGGMTGSLVGGMFSGMAHHCASSRHERREREYRNESYVMEESKECKKLRKKNRKLKAALAESQEIISSLEHRMQKIEKKMGKLT